MALADILTARAQAARATATVDCGALGTVTLEALPLRELERFSQSADGDRGLFFAACRDLQKAGAQLMEQGKLARPDGILAWVSAEEAALAAQAVRKLSGWTDKQAAAKTESDPTGETVEDQAPENTEAPGDETADPMGEERPEARPLPVEEKGDKVPSQTATAEDSGEQTTDEPQEAEDIRPVSVEETPSVSAESGQAFVQEDMDKAETGQVSHEVSEPREVFLPDSPTLETRQEIELQGDIKTQAGGPDITESTDRQAPEQDPPQGEIPADLPAMEVEKPTAVQDAVPKATDAPAPTMHEPESETTKASVPTLHEPETTFTETPAPDRQDAVPKATDAPAPTMHEPESETTKASVPTMHEPETTFTETPAPDRQDIVPKAGDSLLRPETDSGEQKSLQGPETELAERVAQCLLDGLRQASWVR